MRMIVTAATAKVHGKVLRAGEEFDCEEKEARLWETLARAKHADGGEASSRQLDLVGENANDQAETRRGRGRYSRRDMRAEG